MLNSKLNIVIACPAASASGYGARSRDILSALLKNKKYNIIWLPLNWGNCPQNALRENNEMHMKMLNSIKQSGLTEKPDIFIQITIPNEFKPIGKKNIGITAGIETDRESAEWIQKGNMMDTIIFSSEHSKNTHEISKYTMYNKQNQPVKGLENTTNLEVLFEGVDTNIYKPLTKEQIKSKTIEDLFNIPEKFNFLSVGQWSKKPYREDRKDIEGVIENFIKTFQGKKGEVGLFLKVNGAGYSLMDRNSILKRIKKVKERLSHIENQPNIYLIHGYLTDEEINELYNFPSIKAMFSCTHGEGYGRPLSEFLAATGKPTLATGWSGLKDYLTYKDLRFEFNLKQVPESAVWKDIIIKESKWANVIDDNVQHKLKDVFDNYEKYIKLSNKIQNEIRENRNIDKMAKRLYEIINENKPAQESNIVLPPSSGLDISKLKKIN